jgi:hypothetical protein
MKRGEIMKNYIVVNEEKRVVDHYTIDEKVILGIEKMILVKGLMVDGCHLM